MLTVHNEYETARKVCEGNSLARFGDGECNIAWLQRPAFENYDASLAAKLREIAGADNPGLLIGIPDVFSLEAKRRLCEPDFWKRFERLLNQRLDPQRVYYSTFFSRPDVCARPENRAISKHESAKHVDPAYWDLLQEIWRGKHLCVINFNERLCQHPLLQSASSIGFVLTPRRNAWVAYHDILQRCQKSRADLFLASVGPVGTVLAYDLHLQNRWAVDFGQACRIWSGGRGIDASEYY